VKALALLAIVTACRAPVGAVTPWEQRVANEELSRAVNEWRPEAGFVVILDRDTGDVRAMAGTEGGRDNRELAARRAWVTGSTLKTFTIAAALDAKTIAPETPIDCAPRSYADRTLRDSRVHGMLTVADGLAVSSNVCASRVLDTLGLPRLLATLRRFHFDEEPARFPPVADPAGYDAALLAAGELAAATPLQVASAYAVIFRDGRDRGARIIAPDVAHTMVKLLEATVAAPNGTGARAAIEGHRVAGKTGTAGIGDHRLYASFVGTVLDGPRVVILVGLVAPAANGTGPTAAAPVFARIARRLIAGER
jgi:cell division protein FtsI (penicillin-binding protein 3)